MDVAGLRRGGALRAWPRVAVTGHRERDFTEAQADWIRTALHAVLNRLCTHHQTGVAISGLANGADLWWADAAVAADVRLWAYIPFPQQADGWTMEQQALWRRMRSAAEREVVLGARSDARHFHARNDLLVRDCDLMVAVHLPRKSSGGTVSTIRKARAAGRPLLRVDPEAERISFVA